MPCQGKEPCLRFGFDSRQKTLHPKTRAGKNLHAQIAQGFRRWRHRCLRQHNNINTLSRWRHRSGYRVKISWQIAADKMRPCIRHQQALNIDLGIQRQRRFPHELSGGLQGAFERRHQQNARPQLDCPVGHRAIDSRGNETPASVRLFRRAADGRTSARHHRGTIGRSSNHRALYAHDQGRIGRPGGLRICQQVFRDDMFDFQPRRSRGHEALESRYVYGRCMQKRDVLAHTVDYGYYTAPFARSPAIAAAS